MKEKDDVLDVRKYCIPKMRSDGYPYREHCIVEMPRYYWRLLDWMQTNRGMGGSFLFHHCDVVNFKKWDQISEFFMFFIDDWIRKENTLERKFNAVSVYRDR